MHLVNLRLHRVFAGLLFASLLSSEPVLAQGGPSPLILQKEGLSVTVAHGDWIVVTAVDGVTALGIGRYAGIETGQITILGEYSNVVSVRDIGLIYHGEHQRIGYYTGQGLLRGAQLGVVGGLALGFGLMVTDPYIGLGAFLFGPAVTSFFTIPGGMALGLLYGLGQQAQTVAYPIGPGQWEIVTERQP